MFCTVLKSAFFEANIDVESKEHAKVLSDLYEGKIFIVKNIEKNRSVYFYIDQNHRDSLRKINRIYRGWNNATELPRDFTPWVEKKHVMFLTFVDIWELKREGKYALYK